MGEQLDVRLDGGQGADRFDGPAQFAHLRVGQFGAHRGAQQLCGRGVGLVGQFERLGQQHRALAGSQVVAGGLTGHRRIAEDAEDVVAELEGDSEIVADLVEYLLYVGPVGSGGRAQLQRSGHRVGRGLVGVDVHRRGHRFGTAGLRDDIEVLTAEHFGADVAPDLLDPLLRVGRDGCRGDDVVGPRQGQIAGQDGGRQAELPRGSVPVAVPVPVGEQSGAPSAGRGGWPNHR